VPRLLEETLAALLLEDDDLGALALMDDLADDLGAFDDRGIVENQDLDIGNLGLLVGRLRGRVLGGWLRGTASVTSVVKKSFSADRAELLNQPMLVEHFVSTINKMPGSTRDHDVVKSIQKGLASVLQQMEGAVDGFTKDAVSDIGKTCDGLLAEILAKK